MFLKLYTVYLFHCRDCIRHWLAYLTPQTTATVVVQLEAENGSKAKNKAITLANKGFIGLTIIAKNYDKGHWAINNYPELMEMLGDFK